MRNWITKEEAIEIAGAELVIEAEKTNCERSNTETEGTELTGYQIFRAIAENDTHSVGVIYLVSDEDVQEKELDYIDWEVEGYEVDEI